MLLLTTPDGTVLNDRDSIVSHVLGFYKELFGTEKVVEEVDYTVFGCGPLVTEAMNVSLRAQITDDEVRKVVFSMSDYKSSRPDGMKACFFKKNWSITGSLVCAAVKEYQSSGKILTQINSTSVCLLPKK